MTITRSQFRSPERATIQHGSQYKFSSSDDASESPSLAPGVRPAAAFVEESFGLTGPWGLDAIPRVAAKLGAFSAHIAIQAVVRLL